MLYALGFGAEYAAVRVGRAIKYAALWVAGGIRRFAKALAETAFPGAAQVAKDLFGPIVLFAKGIVSLLIHAHRIRREQGFGAAFEASVYIKSQIQILTDPFTRLQIDIHIKRHGSTLKISG